MLLLSVSPFGTSAVWSPYLLYYVLPHWYGTSAVLRGTMARVPNCTLLFVVVSNCKNYSVRLPDCPITQGINRYLYRLTTKLDSLYPHCLILTIGNWVPITSKCCNATRYGYRNVLLGTRTALIHRTTVPIPALVQCSLHDQQIFW